VIGSDGVLVYAFVDVDYKVRAEPGEVLVAVRATPRN